MKRTTRLRSCAAAGVIGAAVLAGPCLPAQAAPVPALTAPDVAAPAAGTTTEPTPVLAYYYIWYNVTSWNRAKSDYPLAGRYSSDEPSVMRRQIEEAKSAGIDGFIVSWKSTPVLNQRLAQLVDIARAENFKLALIYEGLDFNRNPLPTARV